MREAVRGLELDRQAQVLRAFALYFQLANIAEQHHRLRRRRQYEHAPRESLAEALALLEGQPRLDEAARRISLELVLTAHPTEAARRTILAAHTRVSELLLALDTGTRARATRSRTQLAEEVTMLWQTDEVREQRPRVADEIRSGLWFFEQSLFDAAPRLVADFRRRFRDAPVPLRFGTWIGGDQDGNPAAGPETIAAALERARELALARLRGRGAVARDDARALDVAGRRRRASSASRSRATSASSPRSRRRSAGRTRASRTAASSRSCGGGSGTTATPRRTSSPRIST